MNTQPDHDPSQCASCRLCGRKMRRGTTEHHLIPKTCHRNRWFRKRFTKEQMRQTVSLCRDCHLAIHRFVPREKELGRHYHSIELLLTHPEINKFVSWVSQQR